MYFDLPLHELQSYRPALEVPQDFDEFWQQSLDKARSYPLDSVFQPVDFGLSAITAYDVTFSGYEGQAIKGWLLLPKHSEEPLPCVVEYIGYGGGRGFPTDWLLWSAAGFAHLVMDTRGQGSAWLHGDTPDLSADGSSPQMPGFMTRGIYEPDTYYYRRLYIDAARAVEAASAHPMVNADRIAVDGGSQGGGLALATCGLVPEVKAGVFSVPFLCHFRRAITLVDSDPYGEIQQFLKTHRSKMEEVLHTLSYFDGVNFAARAQASALFSVGLMDQVCPPSTVFAAHNHYKGPTEIRVWHFNEHEGGGSHFNVEKIQFLQKQLDN